MTRWWLRPIAKLGEWTSRVRVGFRLALGFGVTLLFVLVVGGLGLVGMQRMGERLEEVVTINNAKLGLAQSMRHALAEQEKDILLLVLATDSQQQKTIEEAIKYQGSQYDDAKAGLVDIFTLAQPDSFESSILDKIKAHESTAPALVTKTVQLVSDEAGEEALKLLHEKLAPAFKAWVNDLDELVSIEQRQNDAAAAAAQKDQSRLRIVLLACSAAALALGVLMGYVIASGLLNELGGEPRQVANIAHQLASGNLAMPIAVKPGDTTSLMTAMKETVSQLSRIMRGISQASDSISTAATEIAAGNLDLSKRTEEQAAALEQTSATMEELTATVRQNSDNAHKANELAVGAADVAVRGGQVVGEMVTTMASIEDASRRIADIIGLIDGIAFQTNILALNAAVEAARAGEQGRGFAVVAGEVRSLAQRSADAAKQIKSLIGESVERVEGGGRLANGAGATMEKVVAAVQRLTSIMGEITVASTEQSDGIAQVNVTIAHMDQNTQRNAALVEEAAAAAASLQQQASSLTQLVSAFRLSAD